MSHFSFHFVKRPVSAVSNKLLWSKPLQFPPSMPSYSIWTSHQTRSILWRESRVSRIHNSLILSIVLKHYKYFDLTQSIIMNRDDALVCSFVSLLLSCRTSPQWLHELFPLERRRRSEKPQMGHGPSDRLCCVFLQTFAAFHCCITNVLQFRGDP